MNIDGAQNSEEMAPLSSQIPPEMQFQKPEVVSTTEYISSMQAAGSSGQALAIITAMVFAITFTGGRYREQSREDIMATKRFASEIILVNSAACYGALLSLYLGVLVIVRTQSELIVFFTNIALYNDLPGQGNDFNHNDTLKNQILGFLWPEKYELQKWYVIVSPLFIFSSTVLLVIGEVLDLVPSPAGDPTREMTFG